jgi:anti-anti-sigma factor
MKRHQMAMAASADDYDGGAVAAVAVQTQIAAPQRARRASHGQRRAGFAPVGVGEREHTLILTGELDSHSANALEAEIERLCEEGVTKITLDLRQLKYIDPVGVAVIAFRCRLCQRRGYGFALIRGERTIHRAFEQAGAATRLPFREDELADARSAGEAIAPAAFQEDAGPARAAPAFEPQRALALALSHGVERSYAR